MNPDTQEAVRTEIKSFFRQLNTMFGVFLAGVFLFLVSVQIVVYFQGALDASYTRFLYVGAPLSGVAPKACGMWRWARHRPSPARAPCSPAR